MSTTSTHRIPTWNLDTIRRKHTALTRRAAKLGVAAPTLTIGDGETVTVPHPRYPDLPEMARHYLAHEVTITIPEPIIIDGWTLDAVADITPAGNVLRSAPGAPDRDRSHLVDTPADRCDHCRTSRRRTRLVVLTNEAGAETVIGASCSRDFLGQDLDAALRYAEAVDVFDDGTAGDEDEDGYGGAWGRCLPSTSEYVAAACRAIREAGYVRSGEPGCTRDFAWAIANPIHDNDLRVEAEDAAKAARVIEWAAAQPASAGDYLGNLRIIALNPTLHSRHDGLAASMPQAYDRAMGRAAEAAAAAATSKHLDTPVKARVMIEGTVVRRHVVDGFYGASTWLTVRTDAGETVQWKASGYRKEEPGTRVAGKATVKEHGEWQGAAVTTVTRWAMEAVETAATAA